MIIQTEERTHTDRFNRKSKSAWYIAMCDFCSQQFEARLRTRLRQQGIGNQLTFCPKSDCARFARRKGGKLRELIEKRTEEKYGSKCVFANPDIIEKVRQSNAISEVHHRRIQRTKETNLKRYGVPNAFQSDVIKAKQRKTMVERYGVEYPLQSSSIKEKWKQTNLERYGAETTFSILKFRKKAHETMLREGTFKQISKPERRFLECLQDHFGVNTVESQKFVNCWPIDIYVKSLDLYVQVDGVYWHGLDRPLGVIQEFKKPRGKTIYEKYLTDREQDRWFHENALKLVRVTDKQVFACKNAGSLLELLKVSKEMV